MSTNFQMLLPGRIPYLMNRTPQLKQLQKYHVIVQFPKTEKINYLLASFDAIHSFSWPLLGCESPASPIKRRDVCLWMYTFLVLMCWLTNWCCAKWNNKQTRNLNFVSTTFLLFDSHQIFPHPRTEKLESQHATKNHPCPHLSSSYTPLCCVIPLSTHYFFSSH